MYTFFYENHQEYIIKYSYYKTFRFYTTKHNLNAIITIVNFKLF